MIYLYDAYIQACNKPSWQMTRADHAIVNGAELMFVLVVFALLFAILYIAAYVSTLRDNMQRRSKARRDNRK